MHIYAVKCVLNHLKLISGIFHAVSILLVVWYAIQYAHSQYPINGIDEPFNVTVEITMPHMLLLAINMTSVVKIGLIHF